MKTSVMFQFNYCLLIWIFHSRKLNDRINSRQERALTQDRQSKLLEQKGNSVTTHLWNSQAFVNVDQSWQWNFFATLIFYVTFFIYLSFLVLFNFVFCQIAVTLIFSFAFCISSVLVLYIVFSYFRERHIAFGLRNLWITKYWWKLKALIQLVSVVNSWIARC